MNIEELAKALGERSPEVLGYVRVSSDKQADNESLAAQAEAIAAHAKARGLDVPFIISEVGSAAKPMFAVRLKGQKATDASEAVPRPLFMTALAYLRERQGGDLIVWKLDRLSRVAQEQEMLFSELGRMQVRLHSTWPGEQQMLESGESADPVRVFVRQVLAAQAQFERAVIEARMKSGLTYKAARGGWTGGAPPFGYQALRGELHPDAYQAAMVRWIFAARKQGHTLQSIAAFIQAHKDPRDGNKYPHQKISRILAHEELYRGRYRNCYGQVHMRPDLKILPDDEEALLDHNNTLPRTS